MHRVFLVVSMFLALGCQSSNEAVGQLVWRLGHLSTPLQDPLLLTARLRVQQDGKGVSSQQVDVAIPANSPDDYAIHVEIGFEHVLIDRVAEFSIELLQGDRLLYGIVGLRTLSQPDERIRMPDTDGLDEISQPDVDGDGASDLAEILSGHSPDDQTDFPSVVITILAPATVELDEIPYDTDLAVRGEAYTASGKRLDLRWWFSSYGATSSREGDEATFRTYSFGAWALTAQALLNETILGSKTILLRVCEPGTCGTCVGSTGECSQMPGMCCPGFSCWYAFCASCRRQFEYCSINNNCCGGLGCVQSPPTTNGGLCTAITHPAVADCTNQPGRLWNGTDCAIVCANTHETCAVDTDCCFLSDRCYPSQNEPSVSICLPVCGASGYGYCDRGGTCNVPSCAAIACGDGFRAGDEECDDGNIDPDDGCSPACAMELNSVCNFETLPTDCWPCDHNGVKDANEECDSGLEQTPDCDGDCTVPQCGDGVWNSAAGEICDDDNTSDCGDCSADCQLGVFNPPTCGDGVLCPGSRYEECDDGGLHRGDGCDENCHREYGWECTTTEGAQSVCSRL